MKFLLFFFIQRLRERQQAYDLALAANADMNSEYVIFFKDEEKQRHLYLSSYTVLSLVITLIYHPIKNYFPLIWISVLLVTIHHQRCHLHLMMILLKH